MSDREVQKKRKRAWCRCVKTRNCGLNRHIDIYSILNCAAGAVCVAYMD